MTINTIITGITGQDGSYLASQLLEKGHHVYGIIRRASNFNTQRIDHIYDHPNLKLIYGDLADSSSLSHIIGDIKPDFFYNLGAQSHVRVSFDIPEYSFDVDALGVLRCLEIIRKHSPKTRFYQASSSELYGSTSPPQNESTPFHPRSPYAVAKLAAYWSVINYRESYDLFAVNGILFNHESEMRGATFISKKCTKAAARIKFGLQDKLYLGNLDARRDWGHAADYTRAMQLIVEADMPDDYVVGTGEAHSVRELLEESFNLVGLDPYKYVEIDPRLFRPAEVDFLQADPTKIKTKLGWEPKISFKELIKGMVNYDLKEAEEEAVLKNYNSQKELLK